VLELRALEQTALALMESVQMALVKMASVLRK
jgi:hypothetical protein